MPSKLGVTVACFMYVSTSSSDGASAKDMLMGSSSLASTTLVLGDVSAARFAVSFRARSTPLKELMISTSSLTMWAQRS